jgi:hypothetical protein
LQSEARGSLDRTLTIIQTPSDTALCKIFHLQRTVTFSTGQLPRVNFDNEYDTEPGSTKSDAQPPRVLLPQ